VAEYAELHCHSWYSLLDGASAPEVLVRRAAELGLTALALTDHDALYGAPEFVAAARRHGVRPILGAELTLTGELPDRLTHLTLLVANGRGWRNLCYLIARARHHATVKGTAYLPADELGGHTDGLLALSGCRQGALATALLADDAATAQAIATRYRALFGRASFIIELQQHLLPDDERLNAELVELAETFGVDYVATNNVHYAQRDGHRLQDVLVCIRHGCALDNEDALTHLRPNSEYTLKSAEQMAGPFAAYPRAITNTVRLAERCHFELAYGIQDLPAFPTPAGQSAAAYLRALCEAGAQRRFGVMPEAVSRQLAHELDVIERCGLSNYFLIVHDIVRFAQANGIRGQGRGSAANSLVAYLLDISPIDPLRHNLVFERFLSAERAFPPDVDFDFQADRREEVIQYVYGRYGADHAAMACTFVTFRARSALRDVGKALGFPTSLLDRASGLLETHHAGQLATSPRLREELGDLLDAPLWQQLFDLCSQMQGLPRHLGIHNGGMIVTGAPLFERVPTEPATMPDRVVVQWDKEALEQVGLIKIDLLGLRMLSAIQDALTLIEQEHGAPLDLAQLTFDDPAVYAMLTKADTVGVFQVESRAQAQVLPRLAPRTFNDVIVSISLIRPGPVQGNMVHPYLRRRQGREPVTYADPRLRAALAETLGVVLFQEQVLKIARDFAGFSPGQGELLRRALGSKRAAEELAELREAFVEGAVTQGAPRKVSEAVFGQLAAFAGYSFPKSHAAAFAVLVYQSAYLKLRHPAALLAGLLDNQPMGFWAPGVLVQDARRHGVRLLPPHINRSSDHSTLESGVLRLGLRTVSGIGEVGATRILTARAASPFTSLSDFCRRSRLPRRLIEQLIVAGALDIFGERRQLLWDLDTLRYMEEELDLVFPPDAVDLPLLSEEEAAQMQRTALGFGLREHPLAAWRAKLRAAGYLSSADLSQPALTGEVRVVGIVVMHQSPPTAKGHHFLTLEDEDGFINVVVRPAIYAQQRAIWRETSLLAVTGIIERQKGVVNVVARVAQAMRAQS
jgi:error-prone DNA polymerase